MPFGTINPKVRSFSGITKANGVFRADEVYDLVRSGGWHPANLAKLINTPQPAVAPVNNGGNYGCWHPILHPNGRLVILVNTFESTGALTFSNAPPLIAYSLDGAAPVTVQAYTSAGNYDTIREAVLSPDGKHLYVQYRVSLAEVFDCDGVSLSNRRNAFTAGTPTSRGLGYPNAGNVSYPRTAFSADGTHILGIGTTGARTQASTRNATTGLLSQSASIGDGSSFGQSAENNTHGGGDWYGNGNQFNMLVAPNKRQVFSWGNKGSSDYCCFAIGPCNIDAGTISSRTWTDAINATNTRQIFSPQWTFDSLHLILIEADRTTLPGIGGLYRLTTNGAGGSAVTRTRIEPSVSFIAFACTDTEVLALAQSGVIYAYKYSDGSWSRRTVAASSTPSFADLNTASMHSAISFPKLVGYGKKNNINNRQTHSLRAVADATSNPAFV